MPLHAHRYLPGTLLLSLTATTLPALGQVQWEPVPLETSNTKQPLPPTAPNWEPVPGSPATNLPSSVVWEPVSPAEENAPAVVWTPVQEPAEGETPVIAEIEADPRPTSTKPELPPPPQLQALNRSVAYSDGLVGPDIGWNVPNGFRWSQRWFGEASLRGFSLRPKGSDFFAWNNGDGTAQINLNLVQTGSWSIGINTSFRSVYQGDQTAGGATRVGEGISSGFRIATSLGDTAGIAFGGEQIIQWDDKTDTGRNFYLMASKGWWLGNQGRDFPLLIANGGIGSTKFAQNANLRFACINDVQNRTDTFAIDNDLCWGPIGTLGLVWNEWWGLFLEYNSSDAIVGASMNLTGGIPMRLTWGVNFAREDKVLPSTRWNWVFRAGIGF